MLYLKKRDEKRYKSVFLPVVFSCGLWWTVQLTNPVPAVTEKTQKYIFKKSLSEKKNGFKHSGYEKNFTGGNSWRRTWCAEAIRTQLK